MTTPATAEQMEAVIKGLADIKNSMSDFKQEIKQELATMKTDLKKDLDDQLQKVSGEIKAQGTQIAEMQTRVSEVEDWRAEMSDIIMEQEEQLKVLQAKVLDAQARSMRNNIRIFNCPEDATEGKEMVKFLEELLWASLDLQDGTELQIMRAHRSLAPKPKDSSAPPRSIVANFLQYDTKEMILRKAWATEVKIGGRRIGFDHDYPPEIVKLRKEYIPLKKILKQEGISFSSPFTKLRVQWPEGTTTYMNAKEAARAIRAKGLVDKGGTPAKLPRRGSPDSPSRDEAQTPAATGETSGEGDKDKQKGMATAWSQLMKRTGHNRGAASKAKEKMKSLSRK